MAAVLTNGAAWPALAPHTGQKVRSGASHRYNPMRMNRAAPDGSTAGKIAGRVAR
jgi:hypothetical protein